MNHEISSSKKREQRVEERLRHVVSGRATIAEAAGLNREQLYEIARKGYLLFTQGRLDDARKIYEGLVAANPYDSVFRCHLGAVLWRGGNTNRAFDEYDAAVRYNFANIDARAGRGELFIMRGEFEKGINDLQRALELDPDCVRPSTQRARALLIGLMKVADGRTQE